MTLNEEENFPQYQYNTLIRLSKNGHTSSNIDQELF